MTTFVPRYALDPTGINPDNFVANEPHILADYRVRAIVPKEGAFYGDSVLVVDLATGRPLTPGVHFVPQEFLRTPSDLYGKKIYTILLVIDKSVSANVSISYQAVGGHYNRQSTGLKQLLEKKRDDGSDYSFYDVVGRPEVYEPVPHFHSLDDGLKFEYLTTALERIRNAILWSDSIVYQDIYNYIDKMLLDLEARLQIQMDSFVYPILLDFKAQLNKTWLGLELVENLETATRAEGAKAAQKDTKFTDFLTRKYVALDTVVAFKNILYDHLVSKEKTNLGKSQAVFIPATKEALFGMVNGAVASLLSKRETMTTIGNFDPNCYPDNLDADTRVAVVKIVNNRNNGGGIFMAYEYGGRYCYLGTAQSGVATSAITWTRFLFADDMKVYIDDLSAHIQDMDNPHDTNKDQCGLGNVENLPVVTREEILCLKAVRKYMTFDAFLLFVKTFMIGKNGSAADPGDESNEPLENCQILYCPASPCGCGTGGSAPPPPPAIPPAGQLIEQFCRGVDSWGKYTNGTGGSYEAIIMTNAPDCGYTPPPLPPPAGQLQSEFCKGYDKWGIYSDGAGGTYEATISTNHADCGYVAANPTLVFSTNRSVISKGTNETLTTVLNDFPPNKTIALEYWIKSPALNGNQPFKSMTRTVVTNGQGVATDTYNHTDDGTTAPRGTYDNWVTSTNPVVESNHITRVLEATTVTYNRVLTYAVTKTMIRPGDKNSFTWSFSGYPPNTTVFFQVVGQIGSSSGYSSAGSGGGYGGVQNLQPTFGGSSGSSSGSTGYITTDQVRFDSKGTIISTEPIITMTASVQINSAGTGVYTFSNAEGDDGNMFPRTTVYNWIRDPSAGVNSNLVAVEFKAGLNPAAGTKLSEKCVGVNLVGVFANGSGGSYESVITYNAPSCGGGSGGSGGSTGGYGNTRTIPIYFGSGGTNLDTAWQQIPGWTATFTRASNGQVTMTAITGYHSGAYGIMHPDWKLGIQSTGYRSTQWGDGYSSTRYPPIVSQANWDDPGLGLIFGGMGMQG